MQRLYDRPLASVCEPGLVCKTVTSRSFPIQTWRENMTAIFTRFTQLLTIESPYRRRNMGPMRLYVFDIIYPYEYVLDL